MTTAAKPLTLLEHQRTVALTKARAKCKMCKLPPEVRAEIKDARERNVSTTRQMIDWLLDVYKLEFVQSDFTVHSTGRHEQP